MNIPYPFRYFVVLRALALALCLGFPAHADDVSALRDAMALADARDWDGAAAAAQGTSAVGQDVVTWTRLREGEGFLGEYEAFLIRRPDWPGLDLLRQKGEAAVARSTTPGRVIVYFGGDLPRTGGGAVALAQSYATSGETEKAEAEAARAWRDLTLSPDQEDALLTLAPKAVAAQNSARTERLLWDGDLVQARRMLPRISGDARAVAAARIGLQTGADGVTSLINAVPKARGGDAGLAYDRFIWRMKRDLYDDAATLIQERSDSVAGLGHPEAWAPRRALLARWLLRNGQPKTAYRVASRHFLTEGGNFADLEFLSGFIALRSLSDADAALAHFKHLESGVATPISLSRALYWQARAYEAKGARDAATKEYRAAAQYQTAYYGLLAAEHLGQTLDVSLIADARPVDWRQARFAGSSTLEAALLLLRTGDVTLAKRFILHLAEGLNGAELDQLADLALQVKQPHIAVLVAKQAAERGVILPRAYFPLTDMVPEGLAVSRALALSIARRESEFNPAAQSHVGARGLMQVMPGTAKLMAAKLGREYELGKLTSDPGYNAAMGSEYLAGLVEEFGPSIALVASGYNAGPGRPRRWITELGDPRRPDVDVVDWVETIPFSETRTYVMRVVESLVIYRAKLRGTVGPVRVTAELKG